MKLDNEQAASLFSQLGNATRLCIIKTLVEAGDEGLRVGDIQKELNIPGSTLSHHLLHLKNTGLINQRREKNALVCSVQFGRLEAAISYLQSECCIRQRLEEAS